VLVLTVTLLAANFAAQQQVYAWRPNGDLTDSTIDSGQVCAEIEGPYGDDNHYHCPPR
jgi:hypothetical protein